MKDNEVYLAFNGGRAGYFATVEEIPEGWKSDPKNTMDISGIMRMNQLTKEETLKMMNKW